MNVRDEKMMRLARRLAINNFGIRNQFKLSAIVAIRNEIIAIGNNSIKTHPFQKKFGRVYKNTPEAEAINIHAEIDAIKNSLQHISADMLTKATLYVFRVKRPSGNYKNNEWIDGMACPCSGCMSAVHAFKIHRTVYSTNTNDTYGEFFCD